MIRRLYLDLDGVLADFDKAYADLFGVKPDRSKPDAPLMWEKMDSHGAFYLDMDPMPDFLELWEYCEPYRPIIITGLPDSVKNAEQHKRTRVRRHFGIGVPVITCPSRDKARACRAGDILVDDTPKYQHLWEDKGGFWITHKSAKLSIAELRRLGFM